MAVHAHENNNTIVQKVATQVKAAVYDESNIWTPTGLEHIRMRPTAYFPSTGIEGLVHQAGEIIINGMDEISLMPDGVGKLTVLICVDNQRQTYQLVVKDNGRGVPIGKILDSYTKLNTSGKFDTSAYSTAGGLYGVGAKASAGVSTHFRPITTRPEGKASIYIHEGKTNDKVEIVNAKQTETGTVVIYEPDPTRMSEIELFSVAGQHALVVLLQKYCFFRKLNLEFRSHPFPLPDNIWKKSIPEAEKILDRYMHESHVVFSEPTFDRVQWLRGFYWNIQRPFAFTYEFSDSFPSVILNKDRVEQATVVNYKVQAYYVKYDQNGGRFGMLNNLPIDDPKSTHLATIMDVLKDQMAPLLKDNAIRKYFLESYKVPLYLAVDVKCPGAEPSGTTKDAFISSSFRKVYAPSLKAQFSFSDGARFVQAIFDDLSSDIEASYNKNVMGLKQAKNLHRLSEVLEFPEKFTDCNSSDRLNTELFLVEGDSAGGGTEGRNEELQGQYLLKGKAFNGITRMSMARQSAIEIMKDPIYKDIFRIMNVDPAKFDRATMYFKEMFIMTDADFHGYHISASVAGNICVACPQMIEAGIISVVTPPLYSLDFGSKKKGTPRVYLRSEKTKVEWMTHKVYMEMLGIGIRSTNVFSDKIRYLTDIEYADFIELVLEIGETINNIGAELVIEPIIIEVLSHVTQYLSLDTINVEKIKEITRVDRVSYDPRGHILVLTHGRTDHVIPLENVCARLYTTVIPLLQKLAWRKLQIYITSKHVSQWKDTPVSIVKLYEILQSFDDLFDITRYKGLASMPPLDKNRTCMDPKYRTVHRITTIGDLEMIFALLGDDSGPRKRLTQKQP